MTIETTWKLSTKREFYHMLVTYVFQQTNKKLYTFNALPLSDFQLEKPCFDVPGFPAAAAKTYPLTHNLHEKTLNPMHKLTIVYFLTPSGYQSFWCRTQMISSWAFHNKTFDLTRFYACGKRKIIDALIYTQRTKIKGEKAITSLRSRFCGSILPTSRGRTTCLKNKLT